jgi:hypothetical protein
MLCERCREREATVYLALIAWPSGLPCQHEFCDACHAIAQAERTKAYNSQPNNPPPTDVEEISALEYLEAAAKARRNGVDAPAFKHIHEELSRLPKTRERLAFEMLSLSWQSLERGQEPGWEVGFAGCCWGSIAADRSPEYKTWLEKLTFRLFELRQQLPTPPGEHGPFSHSLSLVLIALGKVDRPRFNFVVEALKSRGGDASLDSRWRVIAEAEARIANSEEAER